MRYQPFGGLLGGGPSEKREPSSRLIKAITSPSERRSKRTGRKKKKKRRKKLVNSICGRSTFEHNVEKKTAIRNVLSIQRLRRLSGGNVHGASRKPKKSSTLTVDPD